ncbi:hypothetical protein BHE74_00057519 [Ensete ventricosum]|nr:hypothetical protein BHE74_00057519 [Ensete ventricosum]
MLSYDSEKREGVCHEPEPLLVLMGQATTAIGKGVVRQGSTGEVEEEDGDGSDSDVSKAFTVTLLKQDGRGEEEGDVVGNVEKAAVGNGAGCGIGSDPFAATHATAKLTMGAASDEEKGSGHLCQRSVQLTLREIDDISRATATSRPTLVGKVDSKGSQWRNRVVVVLLR